ncbi:MAG: hypothetical protein AAF797_10470 [Planctomycetota bacterium]
MNRTLVDLWNEDSQWIREKSCSQIVSFSGDGKLRDGNATSDEFRELLSTVTPETLVDFSNECLTSSFDGSGFVLQDVLNEVGNRLGFDVEPGRYHGIRGESGHDGIWRSRDGYSMVVELKTTDTYRINLDTLDGYRVKLCEEGRIDESKSSILLAVGRQDTGDLEAQIRGSRHAWDVRVISTEALLRLMLLKQRVGDWATSSQINSILRPFEYTRVDGIIDLLFRTARDIEHEEDETDKRNAADFISSAAGHGDGGVKERFDHETPRQAALVATETHLDIKLKKKGRVFWGTSDGSCNVVCLSSKPHTDTSGNAFWYGLKPGQVDFLAESDRAYLLLVCGLDHNPLLCPWDHSDPLCNKLRSSPPNPSSREELEHWHITLYHSGNSVLMNVPLGKGREDFTNYLLNW